MNLFRLRLDTTERLLYLSFALTILVTSALIAALFILKSQNASQTSLLNDTITKLNNQATDIKNLAKDNKALNQRAINYAHCNAVIIATYTQTLSPITIKDLDKCLLESPAVSLQPGTGANTGTTPAQNTPVTKSPTLDSSPAQPDNQPQNSPTPEPKLLNCKVDLLGLHIGC